MTHSPRCTCEVCMVLYDQQWRHAIATYDNEAANAATRKQVATRMARERLAREAKQPNAWMSF